MEADVKLKIVPIIKFQDRQWTPEELFKSLEQGLSDFKEMIVITVTDDGVLHTQHSSKDRDLSNCKVLWNLELAKKGLMESD